MLLSLTVTAGDDHPSPRLPCPYQTAHDAPLDVLAQQIVAESACCDYEETALFELMRRAWPFRNLEREEFDEILEMLSSGFTTRRGRRGGQPADREIAEPAVVG